ncbi:hypothetical protein Xen7305DRAFT_00016320 [Xenococcus sp. PCC 7305]|uniref:hypothetical protein n=1 Tax=Xenococcus sp. PCC 7305 TaxID=102125 RepID=UPI0002ACE9C4|nr:hypothetical protein [Xenococcus sp. PCC 7305]ELS01925.1 hypothetical protein Xen7305DRAFT_00016320 [Xenococcus sp. PCC 7305]
MNKLVFPLLAIAFFANPLLANAAEREEPYGGKCLYINEENEEQSFQNCKVNVHQGNIIINFDKEQYQGENQNIVAKSVAEIASGAYATKLLSDSGSLVSGILLGPINLVGKIFKPDRDYQQYILQYAGNGGAKTATILNINRSDAPEFQQELSLLTGKLITFREGQTRTTVDIGPDIDDVKHIK